MEDEVYSCILYLDHGYFLNFFEALAKILKIFFRMAYLANSPKNQYITLKSGVLLRNFKGENMGEV